MFWRRITSEEIKETSETQRGLRVFDDMLDFDQKGSIEPFFTREKQEDIDVFFYFPQFYFDSPNRTIRNNCDNFFSKKTLIDVENIYRRYYRIWYPLWWIEKSKNLELKAEKEE